MDISKSYKYEMSSVELNQEHIINTDWNMGMNIDLIDRDAYLTFPKPFRGPSSRAQNLGPGMSSSNIYGRNDLPGGSSAQSNEQIEREKAELEKLRELCLDEKDKFLLSDKNTFEIEEQVPVMRAIEKKIPVKYQVVDKVNKWGTDIRDPIAVRPLETETDNRTVYTLANHKVKKHLAIDLIEQRFEASRKIKVGMEKGPEHPGVNAVQVVDFFPFMQFMTNKYHLVVCDDDIETEFSKSASAKKKIVSNDFVLHQYVDKEDEGHKKYALYK